MSSLMLRFLPPPPTMSTSATHRRDMSSRGSSTAENEEDDETVFNYYFLFLVALGFLVTLLLYWVHRRRIKKRQQLQGTVTRALARDIENWAATRHTRSATHIPHQASSHVRRQDGLDEHGEAPPPYQPKSDTSVTPSPVDGPHDAGTPLAVPLRTLARDEVMRSQPPNYSASVHASGPTSPNHDTTWP